MKRKISDREIERVWRHLKEGGAEHQIEKTYGVKIVDVSSVDVYLDLLGDDDSEYALYKYDIEYALSKYYDFEERYEQRYGDMGHGIRPEYYVTKDLVRRAEITGGSAVEKRWNK